MGSLLKKFTSKNWDATFDTDTQNQAIAALEDGKVLYFPSLIFPLEKDESPLLSEAILDKNAKNISYHLAKNTLRGSVPEATILRPLKTMLHRYAIYSRQLIDHLIPFYSPTIIQGRTSFRPAEIEGRKSSYKKDDTLLHVDTFPSNPMQGKRLLRVFTNINSLGKPRVWRVGEPFENVAKTFLPRARAPIWGTAALLKAFGVTKEYRTTYDHYMLQIHDRMKGDQRYQTSVKYEEILFQPGESWIAFTDQVSHAAMAGQHVLEQTFYLPVDGLKDPAKAPLKVLEKFLNASLV